MRFDKIACILFLLSFCGWAGTISVGNYSFENPPVSGIMCGVSGDPACQYRPSGAGVDWTSVGDSGIASDVAGNPFNLDSAADGTQAAFLQYDSNNQASLPGEVVNQTDTITGLNQGQPYVVYFDAANRPDMFSGDRFLYGGDQNFYVYWNGVEIDSIDGTTDLNANDTFSQFTTLTFTASASDAAGDGVLEFLVAGNMIGDRTDFIDNIQISGQSTTPEPSTWLLMLSGIGLFGVGVRRRLIASR
jgi:hypothetical protein